MINNPKAVIKRESRLQLPEELEVEVLQETTSKVYLVLPANPAQVADQTELSEEDLERVAGGIDICLSVLGVQVTGYSDCIDGTSTSTPKVIIHY